MIDDFILSPFRVGENELNGEQPVKCHSETPFNQSNNCHACEGRQLMIIFRINSIGSRQSLSCALRLSLGQAKVERQE